MLGQWPNTHTPYTLWQLTLYTCIKRNDLLVLATVYPFVHSFNSLGRLSIRLLTTHSIFSNFIHWCHIIYETCQKHILPSNFVEIEAILSCQSTICMGSIRYHRRHHQRCRSDGSQRKHTVSHEWIWPQAITLQFSRPSHMLVWPILMCHIQLVCRILWREFMWTWCCFMFCMCVCSIRGRLQNMTVSCLIFCCFIN